MVRYQTWDNIGTLHSVKFLPIEFLNKISKSSSFPIEPLHLVKFLLIGDTYCSRLYGSNWPRVCYGLKQATKGLLCIIDPLNRQPPPGWFIDWMAEHFSIVYIIRLKMQFNKYPTPLVFSLIEATLGWLCITVA